MSLQGLALSRGTIDRATILREDASWIESAWETPSTRVLVVSDGHALLGPDGALYFITTNQAPAGTRFFLGLETPAAPADAARPPLGAQDLHR